MLSDKEKVRIISKIIKENNTITITTKGKEGNVWSTKVFYGEQGSDIYIILEKQGHAYKNILENNEVFFVIEKNDPTAFIQGIAEAEIIGDTDKTPERSIITRKNFPIVPFLRSNPETVVVRLKLKKLYVSYFLEGWMPRFEIEINNYIKELLEKEIKRESKIKYYIQSTRPWALPATIGAVLIGTLLSPMIDILRFILSFAGAVFVHLGVNAISDYFDYKRGVDKWNTLGGSRVLVEGILKPREVLIIGIILILASLGIAGIIWYILSFNINFLYLILIGGVAGIFYAFIGFGWKYIGLGDLMVFIAWTGIAFGSYFVQTTLLNWYVIIAFLPISLLIVAILHGNNMRDIQDDINSGYKTFAGILGPTLSKYYYSILVVGAYLSLIVSVIFGILPIWTLVTLFSIPIAYNNILWAFRDNYIQKGMLDLFTAKLVQTNSILLTIGIIISKIAK